LNAARLVAVVREFGNVLTFNRSIAVIFSSSLAGFVLPGGIGTDVVRGVQLSSLYNDARFATASVVMDRFLGILAMLVLGAVSVQLVDLPFPALFDGFLYSSLAGCLLFLLAGRYVLNWLPQGSGIYRKLIDFASEVHRALRHGRAVGQLFGISALIQVCRCLVFLFTFYAFDLDISIATVFAFVPVLFVFVIAPISIGGLGVREGLMVLVLGPQGFPLEPLILVGFASHFLEFLASLPGAWYLLKDFRADSNS